MSFVASGALQVALCDASMKEETLPVTKGCWFSSVFRPLLLITQQSCVGYERCDGTKGSFGAQAKQSDAREAQSTSQTSRCL